MPWPERFGLFLGALRGTGPMPNPAQFIKRFAAIPGRDEAWAPAKKRRILE